MLFIENADKTLPSIGKIYRQLGYENPRYSAQIDVHLKKKRCVFSMSIISKFGPLSLKQTQSLLKSIGKSPQKKLGQNFLIDKNIVQKSLQFAQLAANENVIEIGPGLGTLTRVLIENGCHVFAIERDHVLYHFLRKTFSNLSHFQIILGDAVMEPLAGFTQWDEPFKIVANLPYSITTPWIDAILSQPHLPTSMTLMVQKEAAHRLFAMPGTKKFSSISIFLNSAYRRMAHFSISRNSFLPPPKVDSTIIHLKRIDEPKSFHPKIKLLIRQLFTQRRKQIGSLMRALPSEISEPIASLLQENGYATSLRPEQLPFSFWHALDALKK